MKTLILLALTGFAATFCFHRQHEAEEAAETAEAVAVRAGHAMALFERGRMAEAKTAFLSQRMELTRLVGPLDPATLKTRNNLGSVLHAMGDYAGAEAVHRAVLVLREETLGRLHQDALASRHNLAVTLLSEGKFEEALRNARLVESGRRHTLGRKNPACREAGRLREFIEDSMEGSRRGNDVPRGGPSGLGASAAGVA